jgi:hypothetical protein
MSPMLDRDGKADDVIGPGDFLFPSGVATEDEPLAVTGDEPMHPQLIPEPELDDVSRTQSCGINGGHQDTVAVVDDGTHAEPSGSPPVWDATTQSRVEDSAEALPAQRHQRVVPKARTMASTSGTNGKS